MCGIGGILRRDGQPIDDRWLDAIDARIAYRGPDGYGRFVDRVGDVSVALLHRRLSIIDHAGGAQPMVSEAGRDDTEGLVAVAFNGCIYNHRDLRAKLEAEGHAFQSDHSDTETLIHGYRQWGAGLTEHLEGMYAFAIWDRARASLTLGRDWFGEKPLYVRVGVSDAEGVIAFSSDARSIAELDQSGRAATGPFLRTYLQLGYNHRGCTVYNGTSQAVSNLTPTIVSQVDELIGPIGVFTARREQTTQAQFEKLIEQAVQRRLEADVPLGCFLSGGVDSSLIAHFAQRSMADLRTFSVRMPDERYDESAQAEAVAELLGTDHTTLEVAMDPAADLAHLISTLGQPFGDSSILPTYWVARAARQHVAVALSGDGGDELFIGYERYMAARHLHRHRRVLQWLPRRWLRGTHPKSRKHKLGRLGDMARDLRSVGILSMESLFTQHQVYDLLNGLPGEPAAQAPGRDPLQSLRRADLIGYLPNDLLCKVDTASMAVMAPAGTPGDAAFAPLEVRCPFLDRDLVRAALAAPTSQLTAGGRKGLLRAIARKHLPDAIVDRPKMGFAVPIGEWFRSDYGGMQRLLRQHLDDADLTDWLNLDHGAVQRLVEEHMTEQCDHGQRLFALLTLAMWGREQR